MLSLTIYFFTFFFLLIILAKSVNFSEYFLKRFLYLIGFLLTSTKYTYFNLTEIMHVY